MAQAVNLHDETLSPAVQSFPKEPGTVDLVTRFAKVKRLTMLPPTRIHPSVLRRHRVLIHGPPEERKHHTCLFA